jgi:hypothetical protein
MNAMNLDQVAWSSVDEEKLPISSTSATSESKLGYQAFHFNLDSMVVGSASATSASKVEPELKQTNTSSESPFKVCSRLRACLSKGTSKDMSRSTMGSIDLGPHKALAAALTPDEAVVRSAIDFFLQSNSVKILEG